MKKTICLLLTLVLLFGAAAAVAVDSPQLPDTPPEIEEIIEDVQTVYRLTIYYIYLDGSTAAPTYTEQLDAGTEYNVVSPTITGYRPTMYVVSGVMPPRNIEYTVIYIPDAEDGNTMVISDKTYVSLLTLEDYEMPLGLGDSIMNVGICIE